MEKSETDRRRIDRDICQAVSAAEDGVLQERDRQRLNRVLASDGRARAVYLDFIALRVALRSIAGRAVRWDAEARAIELAYQMPGKHADGNALTPSQLSNRGRASRSSTLRWSRPGSWAIVASIAALAVYYGYRAGGNDLAGSPVARAPVRLGESHAAGVATVHGISPETVWSNPNESLAAGAKLGSGQHVQFSNGRIELVYESGVRVSVVGPASLLLKREGLVLEGGGLLASVPEAGRGFSVETPNGRVIDLGTEFGVVVDDFGVSEVAVFEGRVEAYPDAGPNGPNGEPSMLELIKGDGLVWTDSTVERTQADLRRFSADRSAMTAVSLAALSQEATTAGIDVDSWRTLGEARRLTSGFVMRGSVRGSRPYLLSTNELDPSDGVVVVECDVVFDGEAEEASVAILTRSDPLRGVAAAPWTDVLATCVRCSFGESAASDVGVLEAATKHEGRWEPITLSWQGYRRPIPGERYRLVMTDDGVNVSFTVTLADDASVTKTVRCRSLFRGKDNYVAIEGPRDGAARIERLRAYQKDPVTQARGSALANASRPHTDRIGSDSRSDSEGHNLTSLFPKQARRVISEGFDGELDESRWEVLGAVDVTRGSAWLGEQITDATIDTWKVRPYLITRESFSPHEKPIVVVGRFEFAKNYLSGFGGSFATMTRAGSTHRGGDGWEQSLLSCGVRANFWPSGLELDRSLELHAVASDGPVQLLLNKSYQIAPESRVYDFRFVDSGTTAELTLIDTNAPERRSELIQQSDLSSGLQSIKSGRIAFEASWGSPIRLDEVHIFQARDGNSTPDIATH